jgi:hypothetical protein
MCICFWFINDEECLLICVKVKRKLLHEHENKAKNDFVAYITNMYIITQNELKGLKDMKHGPGWSAGT